MKTSFVNLYLDYPSKPNGELEKCSNCGRGFAKERIDKHIQICKNTKERQIYDIAQARVEGTEAGELYKAGKMIPLVHKVEVSFILFV